MIAGEEQRLLDLVSFLILLFSDLGEMLDDIAQAVPSQDLGPEIGGFRSLCIGWVSLAVIVAFIKG